MKEVEFPRNLYKKGGSLVWGGKVKYSTVLVKDKTAYEAALESGYTDDFNEALFGASSESIPEKKETVPDEDDF
jgi:hypothetical protein